MKLIPKVEPVLAWQYGGDEQPPPIWAKLLCNDDGDLVVERRSGRQVVLPGEWLIKRLESTEVEWWTDDMVRIAFEVPK